MKIAIISDTHDNMANLEKFLAIFSKDCSSPSGEQSCGIIHCGDVTTPETLEWLAENFSGSIKVACGNMEIRREEFAVVAKKHGNLEIFPEIGVWSLEVRGSQAKIAFLHKPDKAEELAKNKDYLFIFYGHTHKPWIRTVAKGSPSGATQGGPLAVTIVANPGTLGGVFTAPTYAILETTTGQLALHRL